MPATARARPAFLRFRRTGLQATSTADRACFIPATLLSFSLQGFLLRPEIWGSSPSPAPSLLLGLPANRSSSASKVCSLWKAASHSVAIFRRTKGPCPLGCFSPLRLFPSSAGGLGFPSPSSCVLFPSAPPKGRVGGRDPGVLPAEDRFLVSSPKALAGTGPSGVLPPLRRTLPKEGEAFRWQT